MYSLAPPVIYLPAFTWAGNWPDTHRSVAEAISACFSGSVLRGPGVSSGSACLIAAVCSIWFLIAAVNQNWSQIDAASFSPRAFNPSDGLFVALVLWAVASDWFANIFRVGWRSWGLYRCAVLGLLTLNMLLVVRTFVHYPKHVINSQWSSQQPLEGDASDGTNPLTTIVDNFANRCRQELPPMLESCFTCTRSLDLRLRGLSAQGVYVAKREFSTAQLSNPGLGRELPKDPLEAYWNREFPSPLGEREAFIPASHYPRSVFPGGPSDAKSLGDGAMSELLGAIACLAMIAGAGAEIKSWLCPAHSTPTAHRTSGDETKPLGWGWSYLIGAASLSLFLYIPLRLAAISHTAISPRLGPAAESSALFILCGIAGQPSGGQCFGTIRGSICLDSFVLPFWRYSSPRPGWHCSHGPRASMVAPLSPSRPKFCTKRGR